MNQIRVFLITKIMACVLTFTLVFGLTIHETAKAMDLPEWRVKAILDCACKTILTSYHNHQYDNTLTTQDKQVLIRVAKIGKIQID